MEKYSINQLQTECRKAGIDPNSIPTTACGGVDAYMMRMKMMLLEKATNRMAAELKKKEERAEFFLESLMDVKKTLQGTQHRVQQLEDTLKRKEMELEARRTAPAAAVTGKEAAPDDMQVDEEEEVDDDEVNANGVMQDLNKENGEGGKMAAASSSQQTSQATGTQKDQNGGSSSSTLAAPADPQLATEPPKSKQMAAPTMEVGLKPTASVTNTAPKSKRIAPPPPKLIMPTTGDKERTSTSPRPHHSRNKPEGNGGIPPPAPSTASTHTTCNIKCLYCELKFNRALFLERHVAKNHRKGKKWSCIKCPNMYCTSKSLKTHYLADHLGRRVSCPNCHKVYRSEEILKKHLKKCLMHLPGPF